MALLLTARDVMSVLPYQEAIETVDEAFCQFARGAYAMPQRLMMTVHSGVLAAMPAADHDIMGIKVATVHPENPHNGAPAVQATVLLLRERNGELLSILDGTSLTILRTCAASAVATRCLASPEAQELGVLGSGPLALGHVRAIASVRHLRRVRIYSPRLKSRAQHVRSSLADLGTPIELAESAEAAVRGSSIVVLATSAREPILRWDWITPGAHINAVGSHHPRARELDTATVVHSRVICDSTEACWTEAGDLMIPLDERAIQREHASVDLGDVLIQKAQGRRSASEVTLFKSVGLAFQDLCAAVAAWRNARNVGLGSAWSPDPAP